MPKRINPNDPLISVILPFYNAQNEIRTSLSSVLNQSYPNLEILCINDGSTDDSTKIVQSFHDPRIRLISQENKGVSAARNKGLDEARGDFIYFMDADDEIEQGYLKAMLDVALMMDASIVLTSYHLMEEGKEIELPLLPSAMHHKIDEIFFPLYAGTFFNQPWNKLYRNLDLTERFDESMDLGEDLLFNLQVFSRTTEIAVIEEYGYFYHKRADGLHARKQSPKELLDLYRAIQHYFPQESDEFFWHVEKNIVRLCHEHHFSFKEGLRELEVFMEESGVEFDWKEKLWLRLWNRLYRIKKGLFG